MKDYQKYLEEALVEDPMIKAKAKKTKDLLNKAAQIEIKRKI